MVTADGAFTYCLHQNRFSFRHMYHLSMLYVYVCTLRDKRSPFSASALFFYVCVCVYVRPRIHVVLIVN